MAQRKGKMYESPQVAPDGIATAIKGGETPSKDDIVKSANARAQKRHDMHGKNRYADEGFLPNSEGPVLDRAGIKDTGYLVKKGLQDGVNVFYNTLPPGMDINDQENADIREMPMRTVTDLGYPGDGW